MVTSDMSTALLVYHLASKLYTNTGRYVINARGATVSPSFLFEVV
jgi:hypothetical protein